MKAVNPEGTRRYRKAHHRQRGVALVIVLSLIMLLTGVGVSTMAITGLGRIAASADVKYAARSNCNDRAARYMADQIGDWKIIIARVGSSGRCATIYTMNMLSIPAGDVDPPPAGQDPAECFTDEPAICPPGSNCDGNPAWKEYMDREAREQVRFRGQNTIPFDECPETRAIATLADPIMPVVGDKVGQELGRTVGQAGDCYYPVRVFAMNLPRNEQRFYTNYLDMEFIRKIFSSTGCIQ